MRIQKQNKHGEWDTVTEGSHLRRIMSDWGKYVYEFTDNNKNTYHLTLDAIDLEKIKGQRGLHWWRVC